MQEKVTTILFALLRSAMTEKEMTAEERNLYSEEVFSPLFSLAKKHDMAHLVAVGLEKNGLLDKNNSIVQQFQQEQMKAVYRYEQLNYELSELCETLENAKIPFIPLKGSVIRAYYPEPWYRTSCDIDVLVKETDLDRATDVLVKKLEYDKEGRTSHDISLYTQGGNHIELHYDLVEDGRANEARKILSEAWVDTTVKEGYTYWREMTDDMFYFYHIAHATKHFECGGCGIRPFIDLWILDNRVEADKRKRDALLEKGGLLQFTQVARKLSKAWLEGAEADAVTWQMEEYVLRGGVYGNTENRVALQQQKKGGKAKYLLSRIFLPYEVIKYQYPILQKHRWLTPFLQMRRWFRLVFIRERAKRAMQEFKQNKHLSAEEAIKVQEFLSNVGL